MALRRRWLRVTLIGTTVLVALVDLEEGAWGELPAA